MDNVKIEHHLHKRKITIKNLNVFLATSNFVIRVKIVMVRSKLNHICSNGY